MTRAAVGIITVAAGLAVGAGPQQPPPGEPPPQTFRAGTVVVEVDAMVVDGNRRFVGDLGPGDFEVLEDGVPQKVEMVYVVRGTSVSTAAGEAGVAAPGAPVQPQAAVPASAPRRVFVLFFDEPHLEQGAFKRLRTAAEDFITGQFQPGDVGGVLIGGKMAGNRLTSNREELVQAVKSAKLAADATRRRRDLQDWPRMSDVEAIRIAIASDGAVLQQVVDRATREAPGSGRVMVDYTPDVMQKARNVVSELRQASAQTVKTLAALLNGLARFPGRKTVVLMTDGFYVEEAMADLRQIVGMAARSNVRLYAIDGRGVSRGALDTEITALNPMETGAAIPTDIYNTIEDGPNTLAVDTGGYVIRNTNDFKSALAEVAEDTSHYYVIGYSPSNTKMDGKFRTVSVKVKRPGLSVRARKGYLATPDAARTVPRAPQASEPEPSERPAPEPTNPAAPVPVSPTPPAPAPTASPEPAAAAEVPEAAAAIALRPDTEARVRALAAGHAESGDAKRLASKGWDLYSKGDLEGAERALGEAVTLPGAAPWESYALGFAQFGLGKPKEAAQSWERVRGAVPEFEAVYLDLADAYLQLGDPGQSIRVLRAAEARWPADTEILNALGTIQVRRNALDDAVDTFQRAVDTRPDEALAYFNLGRTYELRYYKMRRFSATAARWFDNPADAKKALESYEAYLKIGGPYEDEARTAVGRLQWATAKK